MWGTYPSGVHNRSDPGYITTPHFKYPKLQALEAQGTATDQLPPYLALKCHALPALYLPLRQQDPEGFPRLSVCPTFLAKVACYLLGRCFMLNCKSCFLVWPFWGGGGKGSERDLMDFRGPLSRVMCCS